MQLKTVLPLLVAVLGLAGAAQAQQAAAAPPPPTGYLGLVWALDPDFALRPFGDETRPARHPTVARVAPGSPAAAAGIQVGDTIVSVDGLDARSRNIFRDRTPGRTLHLVLRRGTAQVRTELIVAPARDPERRP